MQNNPEKSGVKAGTSIFQILKSYTNYLIINTFTIN